MARINILDKSVYNQISAGEVVENPASIVKELVENSVDAGATSIDVAIESGGIKSVTVTDNGCGMEKEDLRLAIMPHATSKIKTAADIDCIGTLGFRGEALASIATISELTIKSKFVDSSVGNSLEVKGGEIVSETICAMSCGTQISVRSLFFNTPARFKFLKTPKGEESNVTALMTELIFANPDVAFTYTVDGNVIFRTVGEGLSEGIYSVLGDNVAQNMIPLHFDEKGYKISGYTARPATEAIKNNRNKQIIIVNGRVISDRTISAVIQNAYGEFLMKRTFPAVILDIIMPFDQVDVNVHPNKREVRFADPQKINGIIYHTIKEAVELDAEELRKSAFSELSADFNLKPTATTNASSVQQTVTVIPEKRREETEEDGYLPGITVSTPVFDVKRDSRIETPIYIVPSINPQTRVTSDNLPEGYLMFADSASERREEHDEERRIDRPYKIIGQVFNTYILLELDDKIIFLDQHAAHERILFDKIVENSKSGIPVQDLLIPYEYGIDSEEELQFFRDNVENFENLGFTIKIAEEKVSICSVPIMLKKMNIGDFLREVVAYKTELKNLTDSATIKDRLAKFACRSAIKGGASLTEAEIELVLDYFFKNGVPLQCPHGRPTMIKFTKSEIEKFFGRKV